MDGLLNYAMMFCCPVSCCLPWFSISHCSGLSSSVFLYSVLEFLSDKNTSSGREKRYSPFSFFQISKLFCIGKLNKRATSRDIHYARMMTDAVEYLFVSTHTHSSLPLCPSFSAVVTVTISPSLHSPALMRPLEDRGKERVERGWKRDAVTEKKTDISQGR